MQNSNIRGKNLDWLKEQSLEYQLSLFQDYAEMMKILANNLMLEDIENKCGERYSRSKPENGRYPSKERVAEVKKMAKKLQ